MALNDGLVRAYVPFLGATGGRIIDRSVARNHATLTNIDPGTDWTGATINGATGSILDFDGTNDFGTATATQSLTTYPFTLSSWCLAHAIPPSITFWALSIGTSSSNYFGIGFSNTSNNLRASIVGRNTTFTQQSTSFNILLDTWYHLVGVFESATSRKLYLNGNLVVTSTTNVNQLANGTGIRIGSGFATLYLNGQIADAQIWNRALGNGEANKLYQLGPGGLFKPVTKRLGFVPTGGGAQTITANLLSNTSTVYNPTVTAGAVTISANLLTNTSTVYNPTVTAGAVNIAANLLTNTSTIYEPTVTGGTASQNINANLFTNSNTFYNATVTAGAVTITAQLFTNTSVVYAPTVAQLVDIIAANRLNNVSVVYLPTLTGGSTAPTDTSDILTRPSKRRKKRKTQEELDEENIAAQILKARQAKPEKIPEAKKPFSIKLKQEEEVPQVITVPEVEEQELVQMAPEQIEQVQSAVAQFKKRQSNNKKIQALLVFASTLDD